MQLCPPSMPSLPRYPGVSTRETSNRLQMWNYKQFSCRSSCSLAVILILFLSLQVFRPCSAVLYHIPLRQFHSPVAIGAVEKISLNNGNHQVVRRDALSHMKNNLNGLSGDGYYIDVDIGSPPQRMQVLVDTGSSNFAVATESDPNLSHYFLTHNSSTFIDEGTNIYVLYTEGEWDGTLATDVVSLPSAGNISAKVYIACITESKNFFVADAEWQGILGLAYNELARPDSTYPPFWDSLLLANREIDNVFSIQLCGSSFVHTREKPLMEGSLVIGGVVPSMSKSSLFYTPIYKPWYYEVVLTDVQVAGNSLDMDCKEYNFDKTIVDSGTTNIRLPNKVFNAVVNAIQQNIAEKGSYSFDSPGRDFFSGDDLRCYTDMALPFSIFPVISFSLFVSENSSFRLDLTPQHYLRPVATVDGDETFPDQSCVKFGISPSSSGTVLGAVLMEAFYVVFDRKLSRIGFGQTSCPLPDPDNPVLDVTISGPHIFSNKNYSSCAYKKPESSEKTFLVVSYVMAALSVLVILPLVMMFFMWTRRLMSRRDGYHEQEDTSETQNVLSDS